MSTPVAFTAGLPDDLPDNLGTLSSAQLRRLELAIARQYTGRPWGIVVWAFANLAFWLALWPLTILGLLPLWLGFVLATISLAAVYLPTHDAQHDIIARKGERLRWLNELVGHATSWLIVLPFNVLRVTHLEHHRHTNVPGSDPDMTTKAPGPWSAIWRSVVERQPAAQRNRDYADALMRNGRMDLVALGAIYRIGFVAILSALAWSGFALEAFFLWWLPMHIAVTYTIFFLSWAPHHPGEGRGRYDNARSWKSKLGNIGSAGMQYHLVHHLHPYIPLMKTPAAWRAMRPILEARGCDLGGLER